MPPLCQADGSVAYDPTEKGNILSVMFESNESDAEVALPRPSFIEPVFSSAAFRSSGVERLINDVVVPIVLDFCILLFLAKSWLLNCL